MLTLERRPTEPCGRTVFLQVRAVTHQKIAEVLAALFPDLDAAAVDTLATYTVAGADGLFVHREVTGDAVDLEALFELHARLVHDAAAVWRQGADRNVAPLVASCAVNAAPRRLGQPRRRGAEQLLEGSRRVLPVRIQGKSGSRRRAHLP